MEWKQEFREMMFQIEMSRRAKIQPVWSSMGLIAGQPRVLVKLLEKDHVVQKELSDTCRMDPATLSRLLDKLEAMGYIGRMADPSCRRSVRIALTGSGRAKAEEVRGVFKRLEDQMTKGFEEPQMRKLLEQLEQVKHNLEELQW